MLVTNPIPEKYSMDEKVINAAIDEAIKESREQGIHGKATTPFLLAKVKELTGGDSLESNPRGTRRVYKEFAAGKPGGVCFILQYGSRR